MSALASYTNESEMLTLMHAHPAEAIQKLYEKYAPLLFGLICRKVHDEKTAEEILTETFKKAYKELTQVNGNITAWMLQLSREICLTAIKNFNGKVGVYEPETQEEAMLRHVFCEGKSISDVSAELNLKADTIKKLIRDALKKYKMQPV
jgi:RNA polymerase sigma-70 factor (ECF subfamily)